MSPSRLHPFPSQRLIMWAASPIRRQRPRRDITMKRRPRPVDHVFHMAVFTRVVVDVIDMAGEVVIVTNPMLPITLLPDAAFSFALAARRYPFAVRQCPRKAALYQAPAQGKIGIARRQRAQRMQVIGQDYDGIDTPGMQTHHMGEAGAQQIDVRS